MDTSDTQEQIVNLLIRTRREGHVRLLVWLDKEGFFTSPASTRFYGCYEGGLAEHSLSVYEKLLAFYNKGNLIEATQPGQKPLLLFPDNIIIAALLHDVCKVGAYVRTKADDGWTSKKGKDKGHAILSVSRIKEHIALTEIEELLITYHMGLYGANEFEQYCAEYPLCGEHTQDKSLMSKAEKEADKKARYGKSLRNSWFHNPICKFMYFADEIAVLEQKGLEAE